MADVTFVGICTSFSVHLQYSARACRSKSVLVTAGLHIHHNVLTLLQGYYYDGVTLM